LFDYFRFPTIDTDDKHVLGPWRSKARQGPKVEADHQQPLPNYAKHHLLILVNEDLSASKHSKSSIETPAR